MSCPITGTGVDDRGVGAVTGTWAGAVDRVGMATGEGWLVAEARAGAGGPGTVAEAEGGAVGPVAED